jgi:hypothetical protein
MMTGCPEELTSEKTSPAVSAGIPWAIASFVLDVIEVIVLLHIIVFDKPANGLSGNWGILEYYFAFTVAATAVQAIGLLMASKGWYRIGGLLQIVSSGTQVIKIDGIVGVIGGVKAYRYGVMVSRRSAMNAMPIFPATT